MSSFCMCGTECGYTHAADCPYPYYGGSEVRERRWLSDREAWRREAIVSGRYECRFTTAPKSYDAWGAFTAKIEAVVARDRPGEKVEVREVWIPREYVRWHEDRWSSGLYWWWKAETLAEAEKYGDFRRITVPEGVEEVADE